MHLSYRGRRNVRTLEREEFYKNLRDMVILQNKYNQTQQFAISGPHNYAGFDFRSEFLYM